MENNRQVRVKIDVTLVAIFRIPGGLYKGSGKSYNKPSDRCFI